MDWQSLLIGSFIGLVVGLIIAWLYWRGKLEQARTTEAQLRKQIADAQDDFKILRGQLAEQKQQLAQLSATRGVSADPQGDTRGVASPPAAETFAATAAATHQSPVKTQPDQATKPSQTAIPDDDLATQLANIDSLSGELAKTGADIDALRSQLLAANRSESLRSLLEKREQDLMACTAENEYLSGALSNADLNIAMLDSQLTEFRRGYQVVVNTLAAELARAVVDLEMTQEKLSDATVQKKALVVQITALETAADARYSEGDPVEDEDLAVIEGIGPKIMALLNDGGIVTFEQLADSEITDLKALLNEAGSPYQMANPDSWPRQARLAAKRDWAGLQALKEELVGGVRKPDEAEGDISTNSGIA
ncbi:MAG: hypothetical protein U9R25_00575 [Chloroflexota bacterium]|nr:hypothetical protein [Chloroflexota bacterium]